MFGRNKREKKKVVVRTKEELKAAVNRKEPCIEVQGTLAKKMQWMGKLQRKQLLALIAGLTTAAATSSLLGPAGIKTLAIQAKIPAVQIEAAISAITIVGIATILAILKNYDVVELGVSAGECRLELKLHTNKRTMAV